MKGFKIMRWLCGWFSDSQSCFQLRARLDGASVVFGAVLTFVEVTFVPLSAHRSVSESSVWISGRWPVAMSRSWRKKQPKRCEIAWKWRYARA